MNPCSYEGDDLINIWIREVYGMVFIQSNTLGSITLFALHKKYMDKLFEGLCAGNCSLINFAANRYDFRESSLAYILRVRKEQRYPIKSKNQQNISQLIM